MPLRRLLLPSSLIVLVVCSARIPAALSADGPPLAEAVPGMMEPLRDEKSIRLRSGQGVLVDNPFGSVFLRFGGYEHQLDVQVTLQQPEGAPGIRLAPAVRDGRLVVAPTLPAGAVLAEGQRMDLVIYVPEKHPIRVSTGDGEIESRGLKSDLELRSIHGDIAVRGTEGVLSLETEEGNIEASLERTAPAASQQRFATRTGSITLGITDRLDAEVTMATSSPFATDYSLDVRHLDGQEPNKTARVVVGTPGSGADKATVTLESRVGTIRLLRRAVYVEPEAQSPAAP